MENNYFFPGFCICNATNGANKLQNNLGCEREYAVFEVIDAIEKVSRKKVNYVFGGRRPGDPPMLITSHKLMRETTG